MTVDGNFGLRRRKQTPWSVKFGDALASKLIAVGGIGTIAAIMLVVLVLFGTVWPLFSRSSVGLWQQIPAGDLRHVALDEHQVIVWGVDNSGAIVALAVESGEELHRFPNPLETGPQLTSSQISIDRTQAILGFSDGSFQIVQVAFENTLMNAKDVPAEVVVSRDSPFRTHAGSVYQWFDNNSVRRTTLVDPKWSPAKSLGEAPVTAIDFAPANPDTFVVAVVGDELVVGKITRKKAVVGNRFTESVSVERCGLNSRDRGPLNIALMNNNGQAVVVWPNGTLDRFSLTDGVPKLMESASGILGGGQLTAATPLLARQTLLCGDSTGKVTGWNIVRYAAEEGVADPLQTDAPESADARRTPAGSVADGYHLVPAHELRLGTTPIRGIVSSQQNHVAVLNDDQGTLHVVFVTTDDLRLSTQSPLGKETRWCVLDPGDDTLLAASRQSLAIAPISLKHVEASWATYFGKVWYEGYSEPQYIWQSSAGTETAEAKLSLMPLVFGTLKATLYAMLVSVPLALMAAIYSSEFLSQAARARVKPVVEMMASLPSVVLGFVAALVIAPLLQRHLMAVLLGLMLLPLTFVMAGHVWNLLPLERTLRMQRVRLMALLVCLPLGIGLSAWLAPTVEFFLFEGDFVGWLNGNSGSPASGWMLLSIPLLTMLAVIILVGPLSEWTRRIAVDSTPWGFAVFSLAKLLTVMASVLLAAWLIGQAISAIGWDARGMFLDSYQDRNALLVGIALGFCVIPIIYTISDDALQAVPKQLRSASLGCGATQWQTTMRVVVPSAMSGLFSAIMIGLGRAVGETMVVLMAAGNTPVMQWNPFNGFRTLSATLATELPEAAKGSTHFRTLFLAALLLFMLTLAANTIAEMVRIRFRKRASQL